MTEEENLLIKFDDIDSEGDIDAAIEYARRLNVDFLDNREYINRKVQLTVEHHENNIQLNADMRRNLVLNQNMTSDYLHFLQSVTVLREDGEYDDFL